MSAGSVWDRLDELSTAELSSLAAAAESVIADESGDDEDYASMPVGATGAAVAAELREDGTSAGSDEVAHLIREPEQARELTIAMLRAMREMPVLAEAIEEAYESRRGMLAIDPELIAAGALLLFVLKLKRIKIGKVDISFYEARDNVMAQLKNMLGQ